MSSLLPPTTLTILWSPTGWLWASLTAQLVKNLPAVQETRVWFLGLEDPLEKEMATHSIFLPGESDGERSLESTVPGVTRGGHNLATKEREGVTPDWHNTPPCKKLCLKQPPSWESVGQGWWPWLVKGDRGLWHLTKCLQNNKLVTML